MGNHEPIFDINKFIEHLKGNRIFTVLFKVSPLKSFVIYKGKNFAWRSLADSTLIKVNRNDQS